MEALYLLLFLAFCYGVYRFAKAKRGTRNTGEGGKIGAPGEDPKKK